jgi:hypothetical protein
MVKKGILNRGMNNYPWGQINLINSGENINLINLMESEGNGREIPDTRFLRREGLDLRFWKRERIFVR